MRYIILTTLIFISSLFVGTAQSDLGSPPIQNFLAKEYEASPEIRAIMKSSRGYIYAYATGTVLEYDGNSWKKIASACTYVNNMIEDKHGNIHMADMFAPCAAYLRPSGKNGEWEAITLDFPVKDSVTLQNGIKVFDIKGEIYYTISARQIEGKHTQFFRFDDGNLIPIEEAASEQQASSFMSEKGFFLASNQNISYKPFDESDYDTLHLGEFSSNTTYNILDLSKNEILIQSLNQGLFKYNLATKSGKMFGSAASQNIFKSSQVISIQALPNEQWVLGTVQNGLFLLEQNGNIIKNISTEQGLQDNIIMRMTLDNQNQIWAGLYNGMAKVDLLAPISIWNKDNGVEGNTTQDLKRFEGTLFAGTITSLVYLDEEAQKWKIVEGLPIENMVLEKLTLSDGKEHLFVGSINGVYEIFRAQNGSWKAKAMFEFQQNTVRIRGIVNTPENPDKIYCWGLSGIGYFDYGQGQELKPIDKLQEEFGNRLIPIATEFHKNILWVYANDSSVIKLEIPSDDFKTLDRKGAITSFEDKTIFINIDRDSVFYLSTDEQLEYNPMITDLLLKYNEENDKYVYTDELGNLWIYSPIERQADILFKTKEGYKKQERLEKLLKSYTIRGVYVDEANENIIWIGTTDGIIRLDLKLLNSQRSSQSNFQTYLRKIRIGSDSLIFNGNFVKKTSLNNDSIRYEALPFQPENSDVSLEHINNNIFFQVAAPYFVEEKSILYSYKLDGLDEKWSEWTSLNVKEYSNLSAGEYTFRAKAKNYWGEESQETTYTFEVMPPWYKTTYAYISFALIAIGFVWGSNRIYTQRLRKQNEKLENTVRERTDEIMQINAELSQQNEEIVQQRDQLDEKNQQIAEQNQNIVSSINYAKRIQTALLPFEKRLKVDIPKHFILFKPRDIVSGDFYWIEKVENKIVIAIADCTGHGVPGAFMAMLGNSGLTDAVFQQQYTEPHLILKHLHQYISDALKQKTSDNRDGMDVAVLVWDKDNKQVQFAGAMNPVYYVQNEEMLTIKGDKMPIGGTVSREREYTPHTINLHTPTTFYLASDGYQDQFGGSKGRKFMTKRFRELLLETSSLPIEEQKERLDKVLKNWQGHERQIDDVLVFGMQIG